MLIVVDDGRALDGGEIAPPELIARGFGEDEELLDELRDEAERVADGARRGRGHEIKLLQEHLHDAIAQAGLRPDAPAADDPPRGDRGLS